MFIGQCPIIDQLFSRKLDAQWTRQLFFERLVYVLIHYQFYSILSIRLSHQIENININLFNEVSTPMSFKSNKQPQISTIRHFSSPKRLVFLIFFNIA
ncbi:hypothetical protein FGO68_gene13323 [Halteria grandinella]|uniref:Uncharacterized protein n=1 Tax=Halteria grandinella TaxID=5974 RepID=A0A8J8SUZ8_HALGN|nr:hypothetical protein FGO68_gene13323 [Halteria grandinella]